MSTDLEKWRPPRVPRAGSDRVAVAVSVVALIIILGWSAALLVGRGSPAWGWVCLGGLGAVTVRVAVVTWHG